MEDNVGRTPSSLFKATVLCDTLTEDQMKQLETCSEFSFQTVIRRKLFGVGDGGKRSCCDCAYLHEYFPYINNDGSINFSDFDRVCAWIDQGECPHVSKSNDGDHEIVMATVTNLDVAVASGNTDLYHLQAETSGYGVGVYGGCFGLSTVMHAVMKQRYSFFEYALVEYDREQIDALCSRWTSMVNLLECRGSPDDRYYVHYLTRPIRLCIQRKDVRMLEYLLRLRPTFSLQDQMSYAIHHNEERCARALIGYVMDRKTRPMFYFSDKSIQDLVLSATLQDHPAMLQLLEEIKLISTRCPDDKTEVKNYFEWAYHLSSALRHDKCTAILKNFVTISSIRPFTENAYHLAFAISVKLSDEERCNRLLGKLQNSGFGVTGKEMIEFPFWYVTPGMIGLLLEFGANDSNVTLPNMLSLFHKQTEFEQIVKLFLYHNATNNEELERHKERFVAFDWGVDLGGVGQKPNYTKFLMDNSATSVNDFIVPLLWECGFPVVRQLVSDPNIPDMVGHYLQRVLSKPRPLRMQCRDTLRRHFPGRNIHKFVQLVDCPVLIKDYILITHLLKDRKRLQNDEILLVNRP